MATRYIVEVKGVPPSPSPISNAVVVGNQCWISGQLSVGDDGAYVPGTARQEAARAFGHVFHIAEAAGFTLQAATNLPAITWTTVSPAPVIVNCQNTVTNPISGTQNYYRLMK